jgi:hypothetical protein
MIAWLFYAVAVLWTDWLPEPLVTWFLFGGVLVFGSLGLAMWRCPACGAMLGRTWRPRQCPTCHVVLVEDLDRQSNEL